MNDNNTVGREELLERQDSRAAKVHRERLEWHPTQPGLVSDLDQPGYFETRKL